MVEASQRTIIRQENTNLAVNRHLELEKIKTLLQDSPSDVETDKLEWLLKVKERQKEEADQIEDIYICQTPFLCS